MSNPISMIETTPARRSITAGNLNQQLSDDDNSNWVLAAPFRAHVLHVVEASAVPWPIAAYKAGVPTPTLRTLLFGRNGKARSKITYQTATRLIALRPQDLTWMRTSQINADRTATRIRLLRSHHQTWEHIAETLHIDVTTCQTIAHGEQSYCAVVTEVLAQLACRAIGYHTWEMPES